MTISTSVTVNFQSKLDTTFWRVDGIHPSSLPSNIPIQKRLFRHRNIETGEKKIEAINDIIRTFIWENRYTFNDSDSRWRRDATYLVNNPRGDMDLRIRLQSEACL